MKKIYQMILCFAMVGFAIVGNEVLMGSCIIAIAILTEDGKVEAYEKLLIGRDITTISK